LDYADVPHHIPSFGLFSYCWTADIKDADPALEGPYYDAFGDVGGFDFSKDQFPQLGTIKLHL
jgi:hypothetical protein